MRWSKDRAVCGLVSEKERDNFCRNQTLQLLPLLILVTPSVYPERRRNRARHPQEVWEGEMVRFQLILYKSFSKYLRAREGVCKIVRGKYFETLTTNNKAVSAAAPQAFDRQQGGFECAHGPR